MNSWVLSNLSWIYNTTFFLRGGGVLSLFRFSLLYLHTISIEQIFWVTNPIATDQGGESGTVDLHNQF